MTAQSSAPAPFESLLIHTVNVTRSIKPSNQGIAADAIHNTLHYSLDARREDWQLEEDVEPDCGALVKAQQVEDKINGAQTVKFEGEEVYLRPGFVPNPSSSSSSSSNERQQVPFVSYQLNRKTRQLLLPHPATIPDPLQNDPCGPERRDAHDVSSKFFFLDDDDEEAGLSTSNSNTAEAEQIEEALEALRTSTGLLTVDTLVLAFQGITRRWAGKDSPALASLSEAESKRFGEDVKRVRSIWQAISASPCVQVLGLSDLPRVFLDALFPASSSSSPTPPTIPSENRLPGVIAVSSVNTSPCCSDSSLKEWCQEWREAVPGAEIRMLSHSDSQEILPRTSLPSLLSEFAPTLSSLSLSSQKPLDKLRASWCLRYTVLISERGILADQGFIVKAE